MTDLNDQVIELMEAILAELVEIRIQVSPPSQPKFQDILVKSTTRFQPVYTFESDTKFWQLENIGPAPILYAYKDATAQDQFFQLPPGAIISQNTRPKHLYMRLAPGFGDATTLKVETWTYGEDWKQRSHLGKIFNRKGGR